MTCLLLALTLVAVHLQPAEAAQTGYAAQHRSLARVARARGMDARGVLFASPIAPLGARLCVSSGRHPRPICGVVVDVPHPRDHAWQLRERRYVEVSPAVAALLCADPSGPPRQCPVMVERG